MPATAARKTSPKKSPTKKPAARKAARPSKPAKKLKNGAMKKAQIFEQQAMTDAIRKESDQLKQVLR